LSGKQLQHFSTGRKLTISQSLFHATSHADGRTGGALDIACEIAFELLLALAAA
jgi:hypothetical protein